MPPGWRVFTPDARSCSRRTALTTERRPLRCISPAVIAAGPRTPDEFAQLQPPPPEMQHLLGAMSGSQEAMDGFISVQANTLSAPEFFAPENVGRIMSESGAAG